MNKPYELTAIEHKNYCGDSCDCESVNINDCGDKRLAQEAQKKLLEYIKENSQKVAPIRDDRIPDDGYWHVTTGRVVYEDVWQQLLKDFGL